MGQRSDVPAVRLRPIEAFYLNFHTDYTSRNVNLLKTLKVFLLIYIHINDIGIFFLTYFYLLLQSLIMYSSSKSIFPLSEKESPRQSTRCDRKDDGLSQLSLVRVACCGMVFFPNILSGASVFLHRLILSNAAALMEGTGAGSDLVRYFPVNPILLCSQTIDRSLFKILSPLKH